MRFSATTLFSVLSLGSHVLSAPTNANEAIKERQAVPVSEFQGAITELQAVTSSQISIINTAINAAGTNPFGVVTALQSQLPIVSANLLAAAASIVANTPTSNITLSSSDTTALSSSISAATNLLGQLQTTKQCQWGPTSWWSCFGFIRNYNHTSGC